MHDICILAGESPWTWALANALRQHFGEVAIILERHQSRVLLLRQRIRRLGPLTVLGQLGFALAARVLHPLFAQQERQVLRREGLDTTPIREGITHISSANDNRTIDILRALAPKVIVVSQTRILARRVLESIPAVFINVHTGITPQYRGHHGAYWALVNGDCANCGVSVHVVDAGVDTGTVIAQARITPSASDNYFSYQWLQLAAALPLLVRAVEDALHGHLLTTAPRSDVRSRQYYHPTLWSYVRCGLQRGIW